MFARILGSCCALLTTAMMLFAAAPPVQPLNVAALIAQLGEEEFAKRSAADRELRKLGRAISPQVYAAARNAEDLEVRRRCRRIIADVDPGYWHRLLREEQRPKVLADIKKAQGINVIGWGDRIANPFLGMTAETEMQLDEIGIDGHRLRRMRARYVKDPNHVLVNRDPNTIVLVESARSGLIYSAGPVLACNSFGVRVVGADVVWIVGDGYLKQGTRGMPTIVQWEARRLKAMQKQAEDPPDMWRGDFGWREPPGFRTVLSEASANDPSETEELAVERQILTGILEGVERKSDWFEVGKHFKEVDNPFTHLDGKARQMLKFRGVEVGRLAKLKKARYLTGNYDLKDPITFVNLDPQMVVVLGDGFKLRGSLYSAGPIVAIGKAQCMADILSADLAWFTEESTVSGKLRGAPFVLRSEPTMGRLVAGNDFLWQGEHGWQRPKGWPWH